MPCVAGLMVFVQNDNVNIGLSIIVVVLADFVGVIKLHTCV